MRNFAADFKKNQKDIFCCFFSGLIILAALIVRTKLYFANNIFSDDECRLAIALLDKSLIQSVFFLGDAQSAPPVFVLLSGILARIFGCSEHVLKFIPYVCSILSCFYFYKVCKSYFRRHLSIVAALALFVLNMPLIAFSSTFKQYSLDVLISTMCIYYLPKIRLLDLNGRKFTVLSLILIALPFISLPSLFFIAVFVVQQVIENYKNKKFYILLIKFAAPFAIIMFLYYFFILSPARQNLFLYFPNYWEDGFWNFSVKSFLKLAVLNLKFYFIPNELTLIHIILLLSGIYLSVKEKSRNSIFLLTAICFSLAGSFFKVYPLSGRVGLYLIPVVLIFLIKPLDISKKIGRSFCLILLFAGFFKYDFTYLKNITDFDYFVHESPKNLMIMMKERFNPQTDIILCNSASSSSYLFYSGRLEFYPENVYEMSFNHHNRASCFNYLNGLKSGQRFWIYLIKDYSRAKIYPYVFEWLEGQKIIFSYKEKDSYLYYIEKED